MISTKKILAVLLKNRNLIRSTALPFILFLIDLFLRLALKLNPETAGVDMGLLAVSACIFNLVESKDTRDIRSMLLLFFILLWITTLVILSATNPILLVWQGFRDFRIFIATGIGLSSFIMATLVLNELESQTTHLREE